MDTSKVSALLNGILKPSEVSKDELAEALRIIEERSRAELLEEGILVEEMRTKGSKIYYISSKKKTVTWKCGLVCIALSILLVLSFVMYAMSVYNTKKAKESLSSLELKVFNMNTDMAVVEREIERRTKKILDTMEYIEDVIYRKEN